MRVYAILFAVFGFLAVAIGAFGAHALQEVLSSYGKSIFETANRYHFYHSLALGLVCFLPNRKDIDSKIAFCFSLGILVFSGSLYALALTEIKILGAITPIGGVFFLIGWGLLVWRFFKKG